MNLSSREEAHAQEARSRQTAMEAERHWWVKQLTAMRDGFRENARLNPHIAAGWELSANAIEFLITERTR